MYTHHAHISCIRWARLIWHPVGTFDRVWACLIESIKLDRLNHSVCTSNAGTASLRILIYMFKKNVYNVCSTYTTKST